MAVQGQACSSTYLLMSGMHSLPLLTQDSVQFNPNCPVRVELNRILSFEPVPPSMQLLLIVKLQ